MEDREIIELYWARDERAISASAEKYGPLCRSLAARILDSPEDAEECVSDTWLRSWNAMPPQRPRLLRAFFARITRNLALDRYRRENALRRGGGETALALEELGDAVSGLPLETELERLALQRLLDAFLESLEPGDRTLFLRRYWSMESLGELAKLEKTTENALAKRLWRLRKKLRERLEKEGYGL